MEKSLEKSDRRFQKLNLGDFGEEQACTFLSKNGFKILERNFRTRQGEIDIVARSGNILVFVEVKTRTSAEFARPEESVGYRKQRNLRTVARAYLQENPARGCDCRFDVVTVMVDDSLRAKVEWIQNAF